MTATIDPFNACASEYWRTMRGMSEYDLPSWANVGDETRIITLSRIHFWIDTGKKIEEEKEHRGWMALKDIAGWKWDSNYSRLCKTHPMLIPFAACPKQFKNITDLFCSTVRDWEKRLNIYNNEILNF